MEAEPDTSNVSYIDEYPELAKRVSLRRLAGQRLSQTALPQTAEIHHFQYPKVTEIRRQPPDIIAWLKRLTMLLCNSYENNTKTIR